MGVKLVVRWTILVSLVGVWGQAQDIRKDGLYWSQVALAGTSAMDVAGSWGAQELNPILGRSTFGAHQTVISVGITVGAITLSHIIVKKWPASRKVMTFGLLGAAGVRGWTAYRVVRYR